MLQLVGLSALYMSSKYEDTKYISMKDMLYLCLDQYTSKEINYVEHKILVTFEYKLLYTSTIHTFAILFDILDNYDQIFATCIKYLCDISTLYSMFLQHSSSKITASIFAIVRSFKNFENIFPKNISYFSDYKLSDIEDCVQTFFMFFSHENHTKNYVYKKYSETKYMNVSHEFEKFEWNKIISIN